LSTKKLLGHYDIRCELLSSKSKVGSKSEAIYPFKTLKAEYLFFGQDEEKREEIKQNELEK
jgi:hypothetical protein